MSTSILTPHPGHAIAPGNLAHARRLLSAFITTHADATAQRLGFGWTAGPSAPSTYQQLRGAVAHCQATGEPLLVSSEHSDSVIYTRPEVNHAFRFWHDVSHVRRGLSFELPDELELALWHLDVLRRGGAEPASLQYRLLEADLVGQLLLMGLAKRFPYDQEDFVLDCAERGLDYGLLAEIRRIPGRGTGDE